MENFKIRTEVCFGKNSIEKLKELHGSTAAVITDPFMSKSGTAEKIKDLLSGFSNVEIFDRVKPDPPIELICEGLKFLNGINAQTVVALGGGSSIDAAKSMIFMANKVYNQKISLVAVPTTSGTGSEVTSFAVITDPVKGVKYPLVDDELLPQLAILEPSLVKSAPPAITADTGFDVITHAMEAYVSTAANDFSDALAEKALELAFKYLGRAYVNGDDLEARDKMHNASCLAGMAFNQVSLGVNHGIAHALGAKFHIPHGRANAMLLPYVMMYNADINGNFGKDDTETIKRYARIAEIAGIDRKDARDSINELFDKLVYMLKMMNVPKTLKDAGVKEEDYLRVREGIIDSAVADPCTVTNPRTITRESVLEILEPLIQF